VVFKAADEHGLVLKSQRKICGFFEFENQKVRIFEGDLGCCISVQIIGSDRKTSRLKGIPKD
jgi:hypothetical protein